MGVVISEEPNEAISMLRIDEMKGSSDNSDLKLMKVGEVNQTCLLLELPREIRDQIYTLMFLSSGPVYPSRDRAGIADYLGLLRTNQHIYSEVVEILYGRNTFQIRGEPRWKAPELLNLLSSQRRDGFMHPSMWAFHTNKICLARLHLKKLYIPSHNISLDRLKHLFSLLKCFPNLEYIRVVYIGSFGVKDMDVVNVCRLFRDRRPLVENFVLCKRIRYSEAEDISWMIWEMPSRNWTSIFDVTNMRHMWKNEDGVLRQAVVVSAPQNIPE
ncbi:hypothetical protein EG329_007936 [Mollisiaceae sp. DMI_Dod_QoI]|nr:hypothetical protein EG329_007936 [Helotiales sp. DMI_Dod_QoI]